MWLNIRTEYSLGFVYGQLQKIVKLLSERNCKHAGIADICSVWGHVAFEKECIKNNIKPVFGVRIHVVDNLDVKERRLPADTITFIALTQKGLAEIYNLLDMSFSKEQFYYIPRITYSQINKLSEEDVAIIGAYSPRFDLMTRHIYIELSPSTPIAIRNLKGVDYVASCDNWFINKKDVKIYEAFAEERKLERRTTSMHIIDEKEFKTLFKDNENVKSAIKNRNFLFEKANVSLQKADVIKWKENTDIKSECIKGANSLGINIEKGIYAKRLKRELKLIKEKNFQDYFLVVADLIKYSKTKMLIGPARGSSAGSLVCYLMGITEVDPIKYGLVFERFIDINRADLPDIDIDFQDNKRSLAITYLQKKYGENNVAQIGNISRLKSKSTLIRVSKAYNIPPWDIEEFKNSIEERASGDERSDKTIEDAFIDTKIGKKFLKSFPNMIVSKDIEGHVSHTSIHAAGVIVCNKPITNYCGVNSRENRIAMIDFRDAEYLNLLKIDALGLRTLTVLAEICDEIEKPYSWLNKIALDDSETYKTINNQRLTGVFQFEGDSIRRLSKRMKINNINDISALTSICRPGPMIAGAAEQYAKRKSGQEKIEYIGNSKVIKSITEETLGLVIYQEQVMKIIKEYAGMSWEEVTILRKIMAKSKGDEAFSEYQKKFIKGSVKNGNTKENALITWKAIKAMGQYSFNKSHAISYSIITYLCAYLKTHYPLEFAVASLNNVKDDKSAVKLLRDLRENEGIKHIYYNKHSDIKWKIYKGKLLASLLTIDGIGIQKAKQAIALRKNNKPFPAGVQSSINKMITPFKYIYPAKQIYGDYYLKPNDHGIYENEVYEICNMSKKKTYCFIGLLIKKTMRDMNEKMLIERRGGTKIENDSTFAILSFEDDSGIVNGVVGNKIFYEFAETIEKSNVDKDWLLVFGTYNPIWNNVYIENIKIITR